jgi:hypothetical protein
MLSGSLSVFMTDTDPRSGYMFAEVTFLMEEGLPITINRLCMVVDIQLMMRLFCGSQSRCEGCDLDNLN